MNNTFSRHTRVIGSVRRTGGSLLVATAVQAALMAPVAAQQTGGSAALDEIVVTGSRITREGFEAPTPVSTLNAEEISSRGPATIGEALNILPSFRVSNSPSTSGVLSLHGGIVTSDLRGLGATRTLVLVNNRRYVPTTATGTVDLRTVPTLLIEQAEVVTGGASAAWGSDAVAGVVNLRIKEQIEGIESTFQWGMSQEGDNKETRISLAGGSLFADDRLSIVAGLDFVDNKGIGSQYERSWGRKEVGLLTNGQFATNGLPNFIITDQLRNAVEIPGGIITAGPLRGTAFAPDGTPFQFTYGQTFGGVMIGGDSFGENPILNANLGTPIRALSTMAVANFDATDSVRLVFEASASRAESGGGSQEGRSRGGTILIQQDNAFLDDGLRAQMVDLGLDSFLMGRVNMDLGKIALDSSTDVYRVMTGVEWEISDRWRADAYVQYGRSDYDLEFGPNNIHNQNYRRAIDAVVDPGSGAIVCRSTLADPSNGCIPINLFGDGSLQLNPYAFGSAFFTLESDQIVAAANVQGELFSTWAGPVAVATGVEYRRESVSGDSDPVSQEVQPNGVVGGWLLGNQLPLAGRYNVWEAYAETIVPLLADRPGAQELDLNSAVRRTDYSISGGVTTWKVGLNWRPVDSLRFRATLSRDIRAPSLSEFFQAGGSSNTPIFDPVRGESVQIREINQGNLALQPEEADTWTAGLIWTPDRIEGLSLSLDWFDIKVEDVIGTLGAPRITQSCFSGTNVALCDNIVFNPDGTVAVVVNQQANLDGLRVSGSDLEVVYRFGFDGIPGDFRSRLLLTYLSEYSRTDATGTQDLVGKMSFHQRISGMPEYVGLADVTWHGERASLGLQARYVHSGIFNPNLTEGAGAPNTINNNSVASFTTFSLNAQRDIEFGDVNAQLYFVVNNLLNRAPPWAPSAAAGGINESSTQAFNYDVIGRMYRVGARIRF